MNSLAAVAITTGAIASCDAAPERGHSEALRRAMLRLIERGGAYAHPSVWAPFVLVGDGRP